MQRFLNCQTHPKPFDLNQANPRYKHERTCWAHRTGTRDPAWASRTVDVGSVFPQGGPP